jgi:hypothetical protein
MAEIFIRPEITREEEMKMARLAIAIFRGFGSRREIIMTILFENIRLTKEVNLHRAKLGYELLKVYDPII